MKTFCLCLVLVFSVVPAFATITQVQSNATRGTTSTTTCTVGLSNTTLHHLLVVWATWSPSSVTVSQVVDANNTNPFPSAVGPTVQSASNTAAQIVYQNNINGTVGTDNVKVTFSGTATTASCMAVEYSGADQNYPLDSVSAGYSTSGNPTGLLDSGTVAPANANLLVFGGGTSDSGTTIAGSGFSSIQAHSIGTGSGITEQMIVSGNNMLQRATAGFSTCCPTPNWVMQMAVFRDASWTVNGGWTLVRPAQVLDATQFPGTVNGDIGDKVTNGAYASCPSTGCRIRIPPNPAGGCWSYTTQIMLNTVAKPVVLEGDPAGTTCLLFTSASGTAITIDPGTGTHPFGAGVRDLTIEGECTSSGIDPVCTGVTSVGLSIGPSNGIEGGFFENVRVGVRGKGFLTGVVINNAFSNTFVNPMIYGNGTGWSQPVGDEANHIFGGSISQNIHGISMGSTGGQTELYTYSVHFDDNTTCGIDGASNNYVLHLTDPHFENAGGGTNCFINLTGTGGRLLVSGGQAYDHFGGSTVMFTFKGNNVASWGLTEYNSGTTSPYAWDLTNNNTDMADLENIDISLCPNIMGCSISSEYNASYSGRIWTRDMNPVVNPAPFLLKNYSLSIVGGGLSIGGVPITATASCSGSCTAPAVCLNTSGTTGSTTLYVCNSGSFEAIAP